MRGDPDRFPDRTEHRSMSGDTGRIEKRMEQQNSWRAAIEAILFTMGDSVEVSKIASAIEQDVPTTEKLIHNMMDKYQKEERGIRIIELDHAYQLCSKPEMYEYLIRIAKQPKKYVLTDVMLETLSIIAYRQPITKLEIEKIRGVKSDHAVNKLIEYNLVCEARALLMHRDVRCFLEQPKNFCADSVCSL